MRSCPACHRAFLLEETLCPLDGAPLEVTAGRLPKDVGTVLGSYRLIGLVGEGAMGRVFVGRHLRLKRLAAIKWLRPELSERRDEVARFFDEARLVNEIRHPNIVDVFDLVEDAFAGSYYVMELLSGRSLKEEMARGVIPPERVVRLGAQIADALHAVHGRGIVHRDLKPENVLLLDRGGPPGRHDYVKIVDFGVAKMTDEEDEGVPFGTARYMAPEQASAKAIDGRADLYALGVILYEMATGQHPFPSTNDNEYLLRHADEAPVPPSRRMPGGRRLPEGLERVILRCLAKDPKDRFESGAAVAVALRGLELDVPRPAGRSWVALVGLGVAGIGGVLAWQMIAKKPAVTRAAAPPALPVPAPAPAPATVPPTPPPAPAPARKITLRFRSSPSGASVYREGETVSIGATPFEGTFLRSELQATFRFEMDGFDAATVPAAMTEDRVVEVKLERTRPGRKSTAKRAPGAPPTKAPAEPRPSDREAVMDPFAR